MRKLVCQMVHSQKLICSLLIFILLLPNIIYSFFILGWDNPWDNINILLLGITFVSLPFLFFRRKTAFYILSIFTLLSSVELISLFTIKTRISYLVIADFFLTNTKESSQLLSYIIPHLLIVTGLIVLYFWLITRLKENSLISKKKRIIFFSYFLAISSIQIVTVYKNYSTLKVNLKRSLITTEYLVFPTNIMYNSAIFLKEYQAEQQALKQFKEFRFGAGKTSSEKQIVIFVIGETSRAANWSLFGYQRPTNPNLENQSNIYTLSDTYTAANGTYISIPMLISRSTPQRPTLWQNEETILKPFKEAGYKTVWLGGQSRTYTVVKLASKNADYIDWESGFDGDLTNKAKEQIKNSSDNLFIVIHLDGNHFNYNDTYPNAFNHFKPSNYHSVNIRNKQKLINAYDNSIRYTDYILNDLIETLKSDKRASSLYFTSDHGENIYDDSRNIIFHSTNETPKNELHVPTFIWLSDNYKKSNRTKTQSLNFNKSKPMTTTISFHTLLDLANITYPSEQKEFSVVSEKFQPFKERFVYTPFGSLKKIPY